MNPGKIVRLGLYIHIIMGHPVTNNPFHTGNNIFNAQVTDPLNVPFDQVQRRANGFLDLFREHHGARIRQQQPIQIPILVDHPLNTDQQRGGAINGKVQILDLDQIFAHPPIHFAHQLIADFVKQIKLVLIMQIKCIPADQRPVGNILDCNGIKSVFVNQFKKGIPNGLFGAPNTQICFFLRIIPGIPLGHTIPLFMCPQNERVCYDTVLNN